MKKLKPIYLLAGGRPSNREILSFLLQTVYSENEKSSPVIAYVGTANGDDESSFKRIADNLRAAGATSVNHAVISPDKSNLEKARDILNLADIVFMSGGDVEEGIKVLKEKKMVNFLKTLYEKGKPFFGLSAGSIMLAKSWIRWNDPQDDSSVELFTCLGFAPIICDTHGENDDWEELKTALGLARDNERGYGIVSGTAIRVYPNGEVEAIGGAIHQFIKRKDTIVRLSDILPTL